jgi:RNA polymerase sigma-70 factor, ECF subfamily
MEQQTVTSEIHLIKQAAGGDNEAFAAVFDQYHESIFAFVMRLANDADIAEDITQETFIRAHHNLDRFGPPWRMRSWLQQIARNVFLQHLQGNSPQEALDTEIAFSGPDPEQEVIAVEMSVLIQCTLERLAPRYREALTLREMDGFPYSEIATIMGIKTDNVRVLLHRARAQFRDLYSSHVWTADPDTSGDQDTFAPSNQMLVYCTSDAHRRDIQQNYLYPR